MVPVAVAEIGVRAEIDHHGPAGVVRLFDVPPVLRAHHEAPERVARRAEPDTLEAVPVAVPEPEEIRIGAAPGDVRPQPEADRERLVAGRQLPVRSGRFVQDRAFLLERVGRAAFETERLACDAGNEFQRFRRRKGEFVRHPQRGCAPPFHAHVVRVLKAPERGEVRTGKRALQRERAGLDARRARVAARAREREIEVRAILREAATRKAGRIDEGRRNAARARHRERLVRRHRHAAVRAGSGKIRHRLVVREVDTARSVNRDGRRRVDTDRNGRRAERHVRVPRPQQSRKRERPRLIAFLERERAATGNLKRARSEKIAVEIGGIRVKARREVERGAFRDFRRRGRRNAADRVQGSHPVLAVRHEKFRAALQFVFARHESRVVREDFRTLVDVERGLPEIGAGPSPAERAVSTFVRALRNRIVDAGRHLGPEIQRAARDVDVGRFAEPDARLIDHRPVCDGPCVAGAPREDEPVDERVARGTAHVVSIAALVVVRDHRAVLKTAEVVHRVPREKLLDGIALRRLRLPVGGILPAPARDRPDPHVRTIATDSKGRTRRHGHRCEHRRQLCFICHAVNSCFRHQHKAA